MTKKIYKYPTTDHIKGSKLSRGDAYISLDKYLNREEVEWIVMEKIDGANAAIFFAENGPASLQIQSRARLLNNHCPPTYLPLKLFSQLHSVELWERMTTRYVVYAEMTTTCHNIFYDHLTSFFYLTAVLDTKEEVFLSLDRRLQLLDGLPITYAPVLKRGKFATVDSVLSLLGPSKFRTENALTTLQKVCASKRIDFQEALERVDQEKLAEGLYVTVEKDGVVLERAKYVRPTFVNKMGDKNIRLVPNQLRKEVRGDSHWGGC